MLAMYMVLEFVANCEGKNSKRKIAKETKLKFRTVERVLKELKDRDLVAYFTPIPCRGAFSNPITPEITERGKMVLRATADGHKFKDACDLLGLSRAQLELKSNRFNKIRSSNRAE